MAHFIYILYSKSIDKYYVGETKDIDQRIEQHNTAFFKGSYTGLAKDWELFFSLSCETNAQARAIEQHIKKMKSKKYYISLKSYPELGLKLLKRYKGFSPDPDSYRDYRDEP